MLQWQPEKRKFKENDRLSLLVKQFLLLEYYLCYRQIELLPTMFRNVFFSIQNVLLKAIIQTSPTLLSLQFRFFDYFSSTAYSPLYNPWVPWTDLTIDSNIFYSNYYIYSTNTSIRICGFYLWQQVIHLNYLPNYHYLH